MYRHRQIDKGTNIQRCSWVLCKQESRNHKKIRWAKVDTVYTRSGTEEKVIIKGVFSLKKFLKYLENGSILLVVPHIESPKYLDSLEMDLSEKAPFPKNLFSDADKSQMSQSF